MAYNCKICGREFDLKIEERYEVVKSGMFSNLSDDSSYECFDCPWCGCQNVVNEKKLNRFSVMSMEEV